MKKAASKTTKVTPVATKAKPVAAKAPVKVIEVKKAPAKVVKKTVAPAVKKAVAPVAKIPAVKAPAKKTVSTVITALVDVGFGNTLFVRGEGAGLSWDTGSALESVADNQWAISLPSSSTTITYKFLINDSTWSAGENFLVESGSSVTVNPEF
jgi:hypothetical protein